MVLLYCDKLQRPLEQTKTNLYHPSIVVDMARTSCMNNSFININQETIYTRPSTFVKQAKTLCLNLDKTNINHRKTLEVHHLGFLKVHKAGSTTMQNMLFRFGLKRNLTFLLPKRGNYFQSHQLLPLKSGNHYDIWAVHSKFDKRQYDRFLPNDKVNIAIVRQPFQRFLSAAYYYRDARKNHHLLRIPKKHFIHDIIMYSEVYDRARFSKTKNTMGRDFGFGPAINDSDTTLIVKQLRYLHNQFKLVLVLERFEESLVLMRRYLHWKMSDILFLQINSNKHVEVPLNEDVRAKHKRLNFLDYAIYDFFATIFDCRIKAEGNEFAKEMGRFKRILKKTKAFCDQAINKFNVLNVEASPWNEHFEVSQDDCKLMKMKEIDFLSFLRGRHIQMQGP